MPRTTQLAGALGIAILGTASGQSALSALTGGYTLAFQVAAGAVIALVALRMPREREPVPGSEVAVEV